MQVELKQGNCLELMKDLKGESIDMILSDLPYGVTHNKWDTEINLGELWKQYKRVIKENGVIALFSGQPFTSKLVMSNLKMFRYEWVFEKGNASGFLNANRMPLKAHENVLIFYKKLPKYNPQFDKGEPYYRTRSMVGTDNYDFFIPTPTDGSDGKRYPRDIIRLKGGERGDHPTQKPVIWAEYLIKTYTDVGDTVLDNCMGSGTTGVACVRTDRNFIGYELDTDYFLTAQRRITEAVMGKGMKN